MNNIKNVITLPCIATREIIVFPKMVMHFDVARDKSLKALTNAMNSNRRIFLTAQKDSFVEDPNIDDVYKIGVIAEIKQIIKIPEGVSRVIVEGISKAKLLSFSSNESEGIVVEVKKLPNYSKESIEETELLAVSRTVKSLFSDYASYVPRMPKELFETVMGEKEPVKILEAVAFNLAVSAEEKQTLLELSSVGKKLVYLVSVLSHEIEILKIEKEIHDQVTEQIDKNQKEYYLREQLRAIQSQLGESDPLQSDGFEYLTKIADIEMPLEASEKLVSEANKLMKMPSGSQEAAVIRGYLDTCLALPWNKKTEDKTDVKKAKAQLDKDHYGMDKVKERILEILSVRALSPEIKGQIICLVGPPGVGKTSIGKSIAKALGREYARVSLGGVKDESDIRGHRKTYVGSMPGRIIEAIKRAGSKNPLILLDEIDKMSNDYKGDPSSAMLEVLDSEQNKEFRDHYIEIPFDLSDVLFVTTANSLDTIAAPLLDRMDVIELSSYTREEKFNIAKKHLVKKQIEKNGLSVNQVKFSDSALYGLIDSYTREAGVRVLERRIASLCRKAAKEIVSEKVTKVSFNGSNLEKYLGAKKYLPDLCSDKTEVGEVNGLAWTSVGGVMMPLEVLVLDGKGAIELTGSLGDVMKESAKIAVSYTRSVSEKYGIDKDFYTKKDIHIHAPEGAVPKDGPSAGVTMVTGIISALSKIPVRSDVAMTGEITLHGKVLPIGGLREKTMAAYKAGVKTVIIPYANRGDLEEVDKKVLESLEFVFAKTIDDVLNTALVFSEKEEPKHYNTIPTVMFDKTKNGDNSSVRV